MSGSHRPGQTQGQTQPGTQHLPLVVELVQVVKVLGVQPAVDEVDAKIGEHQKAKEGADHVRPPAMLLVVVVELGVAANLCHEEEGRQESHTRDALERGCNLQPFLRNQHQQPRRSSLREHPRA